MLPVVAALWWPLRAVIALAVFLTIYLLAAAVVRSFMRPAPAEPDPDSVVPVSERFRCTVCGAEVVMTATPDGFDLEAPRHCREDMVLVTDQS
ncbi:MAG: hypothetical protein ACKO72_08140 [Actinomycetes bacterium]